ncbi:MAG: hypothetical protein ABR991_07800 [Terracidiphilus sp.]|jgi:hypothetical protein
MLDLKYKKVLVVGLGKSGLNCLRLLTLAICLQSSLSGQGTLPTKRSQAVIIRVPFVGCESDGQVGPLKAPRGQNKVVSISAQAAQKLAFYQAEDGFGVLAPRGWYCLGTYGSNGSSLYISPEPIKPADLFSTEWRGFTGPVIQLSNSVGDTSGRFEVASMIAEVFPAHMDFVRNVIAEGNKLASSYPTGSYPNDKLTYRSKEIVEYQTPANTEGLGTRSRLKLNGNPVNGVAILFGDEPSLLHLSMRLPSESDNLIQIIIQQVEREVAAFEHSQR